MSNVDKTDLLDELELFNTYKEINSKDIRDKIFMKYMYIPEIISKKFLNRGIEYDDIFQIACIGLVNAIDRFDIEKGVKFTSFATPTIIGEIKRYFRDKASIIKVPRRIYEIYQKVNSAKQTLLQETSRVPTVPELVEYLNIDEESIIEAIEYADNSFVQSLEQSLNSDDNTFLYEFIGKEDANLLEIENKDFIEKSFNKLDNIEKDFIEYRYYSNKTQKQIAEIFGVSQMYISRLERKVLQKLKNEYYKSVI